MFRKEFLSDILEYEIYLLVELINNINLFSDNFKKIFSFFYIDSTNSEIINFDTERFTLEYPSILPNEFKLLILSKTNDYLFKAYLKKPDDVYFQNHNFWNFYHTLMLVPKNNFITKIINFNSEVGKNFLLKFTFLNKDHDIKEQKQWLFEFLKCFRFLRNYFAHSAIDLNPINFQTFFNQKTFNSKKIKDFESFFSLFNIELMKIRSNKKTFLDRFEQKILNINSFPNLITIFEYIKNQKSFFNLL